jgi:hypothetical protein
MYTYKQTTYQVIIMAQQNKFSVSRTEGFRIMPVTHFEKIDDRIVKTMKEEKFIDEDEEEAKQRLLEAQYGAAELRNVFNPRYMRDREGKRFRVIQKLDGKHLDKDKRVAVSHQPRPGRA